MKLLNVFSPRSSVQVAAELFYQTWHVATLREIRHGAESVTWRICADVAGDGQIPTAIVAGGVCNNAPEAREAMRQHYELWTVTGPAAMRVLGRASW